MFLFNLAFCFRQIDWIHFAGKTRRWNHYRSKEPPLGLSLVAEEMLNHSSLYYWFAIRRRLFKAKLVRESRSYQTTSLYHKSHSNNLEVFCPIGPSVLRSKWLLWCHFLVFTECFANVLHVWRQIWIQYMYYKSLCLPNVCVHDRNGNSALVLLHLSLFIFRHRVQFLFSRLASV